MAILELQTLKYFIAMISIVNPLGVIPTYIAMTDDFDNDQLKKVAKNCSLAVGVTIIISLFTGQSILDFFNISLPSFKVGGGILIGMNAISMLKGRSNAGSKLSQKERTHIEDTDIHEISIVPLAIPLLAGPGTISTAIIQGGKIHGFYTWLGCVGASFVITLMVYLVLRGSRTIAVKIGRLGLNVMTRIMGLILLSIAVESVTGGLKALFI